MRLDTRQSAPCKVGLIFIISLHKYLVEKYVIMHKIDQCYLTRLLCFDWLKCCITLQCDTALVLYWPSIKDRQQSIRANLRRSLGSRLAL